MPRTKPNNTVEHRISLSNFERDALKEIMNTHRENTYIDGVTATLQAGSGILAGSGLLYAAAVFGLWKAPELLATLKDKVGTTLDKVVSPGGTLDELASSLLGGNQIELRRKAQALAARRADLVNEQAAYCTYSAETYDAQMCSSVFGKKDLYYADLKAFQEEIREYVRVNNGDISNAIYYGLGDIDPDKDSDPNTSRAQAAPESTTAGLSIQSRTTPYDQLFPNQKVAVDNYRNALAARLGYGNYAGYLERGGTYNDSTMEWEWSNALDSQFALPNILGDHVPFE